MLILRNLRIRSMWKKFTELSGMLVGQQGLTLQQQGKIYQCCIRPGLYYCCETWELLLWISKVVEHRIIRVMCRVLYLSYIIEYVNVYVYIIYYHIIIYRICSIYKDSLTWDLKPYPWFYVPMFVQLS